MLNEMRPFIDYNPFESFIAYWSWFFKAENHPGYQIWYMLTHPKSWWAWSTTHHLDFTLTAILAIIGGIGIYLMVRNLPAFLAALFLRRTPSLGE